MILAVIAGWLDSSRRAFSDIVAFFLFAVQDTQRITLQTALASRAQLVLVRSEIFFQFAGMLRAAVLAADGIDFHRKPV